ncbi:MAG: SGNH/GDSL hydrolase family protein [Lentisphaeria bacterium]|nr:SGNH/GDSL hydrolase family protein [Lentisphaeria bacterium]
MNRWLRRSGAVAVLAWLVLGPALQAQVPPGLRDGDTFVMLGDSITHQCLYTRFVALYYYLHYPETRLRIFNAGVGGDRAVDGLARFDEEILAMKPSLVTVLLGMNDGGYRPFGEPQFGTYQADMTKFIDRVTRETQARLVLLTPSMYDQEANRLRNRPGSPEYNAALVQFGDFLRAIGKERKLQVIDMNAPLVAATAALRKTNPDATLIPDAVHPGPAGHLVMAHAILKGFGAPAVVSATTVDAAGKTVASENATATNPVVADGTVAFDLLARSLPFPYPPECRGVLEVLPFTEDLNRETLQVTGLAPGTYTLTIDDTEVGQFPAADLAAGVELSTNESTPQYAQAMKVKTLNDALNGQFQKVRAFRLAEKRKGYKREDGTYARKLTKQVKGDDGKVTWVEDPQAEERFAAAAAQLPDVMAEITRIEGEIYTANQPTQHHYALKRTQP